MPRQVTYLIPTRADPRHGAARPIHNHIQVKAACFLCQKHTLALGAVTGIDELGLGATPGDGYQGTHALSS